MERRAGIVTLLVVGFLAGPLYAAAAPSDKVKLPSEADARTLAPQSETILYGDEGIETLLPGRAEDEESISVALGADGTPQSVVVDQNLRIHGIGDYFFKVSGPAMDVTALPKSDAEPGLRKGSVLWQGFSEGKTTLAARMPLFVDQEIERLPLATSLSLTVDGRRLQLDERASGDFELTFKVDNVSESLTSYTVADGKPEELARALDAVASQVVKNQRPVPGEAGVPKEVTLGTGAETVTREIEMPFHVDGFFHLPANGISRLKIQGGELVNNNPNFDGFLGGGLPSRLKVRVTGHADRKIGFPNLRMTAEPAVPLGIAGRSGDRSWSALAARGKVSSRKMFDTLMTTMWQVAKLRYFDAYLGNPDPAGPASSVYRYEMARPAAQAGPPIVSTTNVSPWTAALAIFALLFLLFDLVLWWSLS
jgi:hypothetical protein